MRWGWFALALLGVLLLQTTLVPVLTRGYLDLFLVVTLWVGLRADPIDARLAAFACGMAQSLETAGPLGAHAFAHGLSGWLLTVLAESLNMRTWPARFIAAATAGAAGQLLLRLYQRVVLGFQFESFGALLLTALFPALVAAACVTLITVFLDRRRRQRRRSRLY